jgi:hypothetical protein
LFKKIINWIAGVGDGPIVDPNDVYPDIIDDISIDEIERRLGIGDLNLADKEDSTANFWMEMNEDV